MINFVELILSLLIVIAIAALLFLITGIIHNRDGYVSIIEKRHAFHRIEIRKFSWYAPLVYHKVAYYPTKEARIKRKGTTIKYKINDVMILYKNRIKVKDIVKQSEDIKKDFAKYNITLIEIK